MKLKKIPGTDDLYEDLNSGRVIKKRNHVEAYGSHDGVDLSPPRLEPTPPHDLYMEPIKYEAVEADERALAWLPKHHFTEREAMYVLESMVEEGKLPAGTLPNKGYLAGKLSDHLQAQTLVKQLVDHGYFSVGGTVYHVSKK